MQGLGSGSGRWAECPACGAELAAVRATFPVHACVACGGAWLGVEASVHVIRGMEDALDCDVLAPTLLTEIVSSTKCVGTLFCVHCSAVSCSVATHEAAGSADFTSFCSGVRA